MAAAAGSSGCATKKTTTTETSTARHSDSHLRDDGMGQYGRSQPYYDGSSSDVRTLTTQKTETTPEARNRGVFGILGDIIALPFRAVGALFTAIF